MLYVESGVPEELKTQLEIGTTATSYEPYKELQTITLTCERPITKWDSLEKREGIWGIARHSETKILDGAENWYCYTGYKNDTLRCYCIDSLKAENEFQKSLCSHFKNINNSWMSEIGNYGDYSDHSKLKNKYFVSDKATVEEFKTWLAQQKEAGTPVELVYKTAEETWEPLPEETQLALNTLHTNYPTTIVTNSEDTEMQLTYVADTKNYHLGREEILQKQILEIQNALISQKISGGGITATDSAKMPVQNLRIFGKSEQAQTTGKNILDIDSAVKKGWNLDITNIAHFVAGETYTMSVVSLNDSTCGLYLDDSVKLVSYLRPGKSASFVMPDKATFTKMSLAGGSATALLKDINKVKIQIEKGLVATGYEPYTGGKPSPSPEYPQQIKSAGESGTIDLEITGENVEPQSITLSTPNGLPGIRVKLGGNYTDSTGQRWICDEIDFEKNEYIKRTDCVILDGVNIKFEEGPFWNGTKGTLKDVDETICGMCNYMQSSMFAFDANYDFIFLYKEKIAPYFTTVEQLNNFLIQKKTEGNPVKVYYALRNPVRYSLPQSETEGYKKLYTNYPTTTITNDENAEMELTYTADTKTYVDTKIAEVSAAIMKGV